MKRVLVILPLLAVMAGVASAQTLQPTVVARQAPVPMLLTKRPPVPAQETTRAETATANTAIRQFSETDARAAIEADGYRKPRIVNKAADGTWHARALRGTVEVSLRVDAKGNVTGE